MIFRAGGQLALRTDAGTCSLSLDGRWVIGERPQDQRPEEENRRDFDGYAAGGISTSDFEYIVHKVAEGQYAVHAAELRAILENGGDAVTEVETIVQEPEGVKLSGSPGIYGFLGLQRGDVLLSVNASEVLELDDILAQFMLGRRGVPLSLRIARAGSALDLRYSFE